MTVSRRQIEPVVGHSTPFHSVPARWVVVAFKRLAKLKYGDSLVDVREQRTGEFPIYGSNGLLDWCDRYNASAPCIVVGRKGSAGRINWVDSPCYVSDTALYIDEPSPKVLLRWLCYVLMPMRLETRSEDSAVPGLARELVESQSVPLPPLKEQREIVRFLDEETAKIDALIEKKRRLLKVVDEQWLASLDGVMHIDRYQTRRLRRLVKRPLAYGLGELAEGVKGQGVRMVRITDVDSEGSLRDDVMVTVDEGAAAPYLLRGGDVLLARSGATVGKSFLYSPDWGRACFAGYLIQARLDTGLMLPRWFYYFSRSPQYWEWVGRTQVQATIPNVSADRYGTLEVPLPTIEEQERLVQMLDGELMLRERTKQMVDAAEDRLLEYRSALITAAVTGQTDVGSAA